MTEWIAEVKGEPGSYEISVCYGKPNPSWGWFGPDKIRIEHGSFLDDSERAKRIADVLNAAGYTPYVVKSQ